MTDRRKTDRKHDLVSFHPDINQLFSRIRAQRYDLDLSQSALDHKINRLEDRIRDQLDPPTRCEKFFYIGIFLLGSSGGIAYLLHLIGAF